MRRIFEPANANGDVPSQHLSPVLAVRDLWGVVYVGQGTHVTLANSVGLAAFESGWLRDATSED